MRLSWLLVRSGAFVALLLTCSPAMSRDCRLALVLALDVSISVDAAEDRLQREGLARALLAPEVVQAFLAGDPVALFVFEWSGASSQSAILPGWRMVEREEDLTDVAGVIARSQRRSGPNDFTGVGAALAYAASMLTKAPACRARTIDVSGDGENNDGPRPSAVSQDPSFDGVTVNALIVGQADASSRLVRWFEDDVLRGPRAFRVLARGYDDYERAMRIKLLRELEQPAVSGWPSMGRVG